MLNAIDQSLSLVSLITLQNTVPKYQSSWSVVSSSLSKDHAVSLSNKLYLNYLELVDSRNRFQLDKHKQILLVSNLNKLV